MAEALFAQGRCLQSKWTKWQRVHTRTDGLIQCRSNFLALKLGSLCDSLATPLYFQRAFFY